MGMKNIYHKLYDVDMGIISMQHEIIHQKLNGTLATDP